MLLGETMRRATTFNREEIIKHFLDIDGCALSIHEIARQGELTENKRPGDWYGVVSISSVLSQIFSKQSSGFEAFSKLGFIVFSDSTVIRSKIIDAIVESSS